MTIRIVRVLAMTHKDTISTKEIGQELNDNFGKSTDEHIDRFFFHVRIKVTDQRLSCDPLAILREILTDQQLHGEWKQVTPVEDWPGLFYGQYEKKASSNETEREKERRLAEVRRLLKTKIGEELKKHSRGVNDQTVPEVLVLITRACLYTPEDMETD